MSLLSDSHQVQRHLQLRIEAQGKYLHSVLEKAQETLGYQNLGSAGLEATKETFLVSNDDRLNTAFQPSMVDLQKLKTQTPAASECQLDSCLTSCDHKDVSHMSNVKMSLKICDKQQDNNDDIINQRKTTKEEDIRIMQHQHQPWLPEKMKNSKGFKLHIMPEPQLDLNCRSQNDDVQTSKHFDLNGLFELELLEK